MAKFHGVIGYAIQIETVPGVWDDQIIERNYRGDVLQNMNRWQSSEQVNEIALYKIDSLINNFN